MSLYYAETQELAKLAELMSSLPPLSHNILFLLPSSLLLPLQKSLSLALGDYYKYQLI